MKPKRRKKPAPRRTKRRQKKADTIEPRLGDEARSRRSPLSSFHASISHDPLSDDSEREEKRDLTFEFMSGLIGIPRQPHDHRPDWARRACEEFWRAMGFTPADPDDESSGTLLGLIASLPPDALEPGQGVGMGTGLGYRNGGRGMNLSPPSRVQSAPKKKKGGGKMPASLKEQYQDAAIQMIGQTLLARLSQMPQRAWILCVLVLRWRRVQTFQSTRQLFEWLQSIWVEGRPLLSPTTESREIRTLCKRIGLQLKKKT